MLSYHSTSQDVVTRIHDILQSEQIPVWLDPRGDMKENNMYDRYVFQPMLFVRNHFLHGSTA